MGKIRLARVSIAELKRRIEIAEHRKKCLEEYLHNLWNSYQKGLISRDFYVETAHKHFDGKTLKQWVDYYEHYIKECKKHLKKHRKNLATGHLSVFFFAALIIFFVFIFYSSFGFKLTGFAIIEEVDFEDWESYADADVTLSGSFWQNIAGDTCDMQVDSAGTPSAGTGPDVDHTLGTTSGKYLYLETSSGWCQASGTIAELNGSQILDADSYDYNVSFWYHMIGSTMGTMHFDVYNGSWQNDFWSITGAQDTNQTGPWINYQNIDLSEFTGDIYVRFRFECAGDYYSDMAIDDINITKTTTNSAPTTPTNISCNGGECNISVDTTVNINASGSTDSDADDITYFVDASLQNITEVQNTTDESKAGSGGSSGVGISRTIWTKEASAGCDAGWTGDSSWEDAEFRFFIDDLINTSDFDEIRFEFCAGTDEILRVVNVSLCWYDGSRPAATNTACTDTLTQVDGEGTANGWIYSQMAAGACEYTPWFTYAWDGSRNYFVQWGVCPEGGTCSYGGNRYMGTCTDTDFSRIDATTADVMNPSWIADAWEGYSYDLLSIEGNTTGSVGGASSETNTTTTNYTDVNSDFKSITNITAKIEVDSYDPRASVDQSTNDPDLWLEIYNGTGWVDIGIFDLPSTYTGTGLDTTNYNFSLTTTNPGILSGWQTSTNQDLRIKGVYIDHNETLPDEINYTNVWITINGKQWSEIGNHTESTNLTWNTTDLAEQTEIDLRARAIDIDGTNTYSSYFTKNSYLNISHGAPSNQAPTINWVQAISTQNPTEDSTKSITFNFTATDTNGASDINVNTAEAYFQKSGETTRSNTSCSNWASSGNNVNFTCTIDMWYFDQNGAWTINVTVKDNSAEYAEDSSTTFTYNLLTAMVMSPTALNWPTINLPDTDISSTNDPITLNNTGNDESMNINITAYNLQGETTITQYIFANNFTVGDTSQGCSGTAMANATSTNVTSAILYRGNNSLNYNNATSGQEQIFFCLKGVPQDISAQSYSSSAYGAWEIKILLVAIIPAGRRRKKKLKKSNKILKLLIKLTDELREEYSKEKETIINQLIKAVQKEYGVKRKEILNLIREKEIEIPIAVFSKELGALESLVKYMKENLNMGYKEISEKLLRNERTIWTVYKKALEKQPKPMKIKKTKETILLLIFKNKELTILESVILHLKKKEMKFIEIAKLLERDQRNIWTIYSRAKKKLNKTNERE